ncbi:MAG: FG-GAP repeat domain-containing protein, partial [Planctomycetia bacterium]
MDCTYRNGEESDDCTMVESLGGGVGWIDFDRDGRLDLVAPRGGGFTKDRVITGLPTALYRSVGTAQGNRFEDVAVQAGVAGGGLYTHGVAVGDVDDDGFADLVVTGYGPPQLWRNLGDGTFAAVTDWPGAADPRWSSSAGLADFDGDGCLDLYLCRYVDWSFENHPYCGPTTAIRDVCPPREFSGLADSLYQSLGDWGFEDASARAGLRPDGKGLGVLLADCDDDGDVDIYVANDTVDNFLYVNRGDGTFDERGLVAGVALDDAGLPNGSMGVDLCDFNRDGRPDIWVANYERESFALYRGEGRGQFLHVSRRHGITALGGLFVGFGTDCRDFHGDAPLDSAVANRHVLKYPDAAPRRQLPLLLSFDGDRFRRRQAAGGYFATPREGRGLAAG